MSYGLNVTYQAKPGRRQDFLDALAAAGIQKAVQAETGCLQYDYYLSLSDPDQVLLVERWKSREAQQVHLTQPNMEKIKAIKEQFVERTDLVDYDLT